MTDKRLKRKRPQHYARELKLRACKDVLSGKLTVTEANKKYDIRSSSAISRWIFQLGLKGDHKERPRGKITKYSESFKIKVCLQISSGQMSVAEASRYFGIPSQSGIAGWMKKYDFEINKDRQKKIPTFGLIRDYMKSKKRESKGLEEKINKLEQALEQALLESEVNSKIIELASKELEIDIRKKFNTKQSKK